jgi:hypothetical protein
MQICRLLVVIFSVEFLSESVECSYSSVWIVNSNTTLADALENVTFGDLITLQDGTYSGRGICNTTIRTSNITFQAADASSSVRIDCGSSSKHFIILGQNVTFSGIFFINGFSREAGGCLSVTGTGLVLRNCRLERCVTTSTGGGIMSLTVGRDIILENTRFLFCSAVSGGAVYVNTGSRLFARNLTIENCSATLHGGGIFLNASSMTMEGASMFRGNAANNRGGAVYAISAVSVTLGDVVLFERNAVLSTAGSVAPYGGAFFASLAIVTVPVGSTLTFFANSCVYRGGAMVLSQVTLDVGGEINFVGATLFCTVFPFLHTPEILPPRRIPLLFTFPFLRLDSHPLHSTTLSSPQNPLSRRRRSRFLDQNPRAARSELLMDRLPRQTTPLGRTAGR